jgi:hypothetical protein
MSPSRIKNKYLDLKDAKIKLYDPPVSQINCNNNWIILIDFS